MADQKARTRSAKRLHVVLVPGFAGFDALGQLEYYGGITPLFQAWPVRLTERRAWGPRRKREHWSSNPSHWRTADRAALAECLPCAAIGIGSDKARIQHQQELPHGTSKSLEPLTVSMACRATTLLIDVNAINQLGMIRRATREDFPGTEFSTVVVSRS